MDILKIVFTGGPSGGKTKALSRVKNELISRGYNVIIVEEAATMAINSGIRPFGDNAIPVIDFQRYVLKLQLELEENAISKARENDKDVIILYDRGIMDGKSYLLEDEFKLLLAEANLCEEAILNSYDLVMHLKTVAFGDSKEFSSDNNPARFEENAKQAILQDMKTLDVWMTHNNFKVIDCKDTFDEKLAEIIYYIDFELSKNKSFQKKKCI